MEEWKMPGGGNGGESDRSDREKPGKSTRFILDPESIAIRFDNRNWEWMQGHGGKHFPPREREREREIPARNPTQQRE